MATTDATAGYIDVVPHGLGEVPAFWARFAPRRPALVFEDRTTTWAELEAGVAAVAGGLLATGIRAGDRVGFLAGNTPRFFVALLGCARIGAIMVPVNVRLSSGEIAHVVRDSGMRLLITEQRFAEHLPRLSGLVERVALLDPGPDDTGWEDLHGAPVTDDDPAAVAVTPDDPLLLIYTSGTTGQAKAATITHGNGVAAAIAVIGVDGIGPTDRIVVPAPLAFAGSVLSLGLPMLFAGACMVIEREVNAARLLDMVERGGVTMLKLVPVIYQMMVDTEGFAGRDLGGLRSATSGGAPVPEALLRTFQDKGVLLSSAYGLTEGCGYNLGLPPSDALERIGWAGLDVPFQRSRVLDDDGHDVAPGETGELVISGPMVMAGYWNAPAETRAVLRDGWLYTGDMAVGDDEGYRRIVDRKKDMIISGGINVYPAEVEQIIATHPDVRDVAVVGVPDDRWGEATVACVVSGDPALTLRRLTVDLSGELADYKRPRHLVLLDELPRNANGKVRKTVLRGLAAERAAAGGAQ